MLIDDYRNYYKDLRESGASLFYMRMLKRWILVKSLAKVLFSGLLTPRALQSLRICIWHLQKCPQDRTQLLEGQKESIVFQKSSRGWSFDSVAGCPEKVLKMVQNDLWDASVWNKTSEYFLNQHGQRVVAVYEWQKRKYRFCIQRDHFTFSFFLIFKVFRASLCWKIWIDSLRAFNFNLPVLKPFFYAKRQFLFYRSQSVAVSVLPNDALDMKDMSAQWKSIDQKKRRKILDGFARFLAYLHDKGFYSPYWEKSSFFVSWDAEDNPCFFFMPSGGDCFVDQLSLKQNLRVLFRLSWIIRDLSLTETIFFLHAYQKCFPLYSEHWSFYCYKKIPKELVKSPFLSFFLRRRFQTLIKKKKKFFRKTQASPQSLFGEQCEK